MEEKTATCKDCLHFLQHYVQRPKGQYISVNCGHCVARRIRRCYPDDIACERWFACEES